jgi:hypothetical protein
LKLALTAALLALAAAGCGGGGDKSAATTITTIVTATGPTETTSVTTHGRFHYPQALVDNFMKSCTSNGVAKRAYCACTLDKLSNNVSTRDFTRIGTSGGQVPPRIRRLIRQAAVACADKL